MAHYIDAEDAHRAASRLEQAAREATAAADRIEAAVHQLRVLTEEGYGNNVSILIELLQKAEQS